MTLCVTGTPPAKYVDDLTAIEIIPINAPRYLAT